MSDLTRFDDYNAFFSAGPFVRAGFTWYLINLLKTVNKLYNKTSLLIPPFIFLQIPQCNPSEVKFLQFAQLFSWIESSHLIHSHNHERHHAKHRQLRDGPTGVATCNKNWQPVANRSLRFATNGWKRSHHWKACIVDFYICSIYRFAPFTCLVIHSPRWWIVPAMLIFATMNCAWKAQLFGPKDPGPDGQDIFADVRWEPIHNLWTALLDDSMDSNCHIPKYPSHNAFDCLIRRFRNILALDNHIFVASLMWLGRGRNQDTNILHAL